MDRMQPSGSGDTASPATGARAGHRTPPGVTRAHPLVASLAGGLRATYAAQAEEAMPDHFASLIARLDRSEPDAR